MSINTKPKWTRQQWRNFIDTRDPYTEYRLIGIEPSVQVNLPPAHQVNPAPAVAVPRPIKQGDPEAHEQDHHEEQDHGLEIEEEVYQPSPTAHC